MGNILARWSGAFSKLLKSQLVQVLARFILDHPATVAKKRVLDLGSGCGAVSIAAKRWTFEILPTS